MFVLCNELCTSVCASSLHRKVLRPCFRHTLGKPFTYGSDSIKRCVGALASFAAATEFTFGTIVQRVMTWPGGVRFHYGHPDMWNKLFVMTRGGISKSTRYASLTSAALRARTRPCNAEVC